MDFYILHPRNRWVKVNWRILIFHTLGTNGSILDLTRPPDNANVAPRDVPKEPLVPYPVVVQKDGGQDHNHPNGRPGQVDAVHQAGGLEAAGPLGARAGQGRVVGEPLRAPNVGWVAARVVAALL